MATKSGWPPLEKDKNLIGRCHSAFMLVTSSLSCLETIFGSGNCDEVTQFVFELDKVAPIFKESDLLDRIEASPSLT